MNYKKIGITIAAMVLGATFSWFQLGISEAALLMIWGAVLLALTRNARVGRFETRPNRPAPVASVSGTHDVRLPAVSG